MRFTYTYRSSDGQRHSGEIEAASRDAAFGKIRAEMGVKPIKVTAAGGETASAQRQEAGQSPSDRRLGGPRPVAAVAIAAILAAVVLAAIAGGVWWWAARTGGRGRPLARFTVNTPQGPVTYTAAAPLPRQAIPGDRARIDAARETAFQSTAERFLARFAEPGRAVAAPEGARPSDADFAACLREPIHVASADFTEAVDLKRIVTDIKREMQLYLAGGGTVEGYVAELERRQRLEVSYRENAERRLAELLSKPKEAYGYWLKANAQLQAMGIYPLALPDTLRSYQMNIGIDD